MMTKFANTTPNGAPAHPKHATPSGAPAHPKHVILSGAPAHPKHVILSGAHSCPKHVILSGAPFRARSRRIPCSARATASTPARTRATAGFSIAELLAAIAIMAVLSVIMATALPVALDISREASAQANADILAQSINSAASDMLRYSTPEKAGDSVQTATIGGSNASACFSNPGAYDVDGYALRNAHFDIAATAVTSGANAGQTANRLVVKNLRSGTEASATATVVPRSAGIYSDYELVADSLNVTWEADNGRYRVAYQLQPTGGGKAYSYSFTCTPLQAIADNNATAPGTP